MISDISPSQPPPSTLNWGELRARLELVQPDEDDDAEGIAEGIAEGGTESIAEGACALASLRLGVPSASREAMGCAQSLAARAASASARNSAATDASRTTASPSRGQASPPS